MSQFRKLAFAALALPLLGMAGTFDVYVGYADDLRPTPFFPSPWAGSANVGLFAGNSANIDAGAVMFVNNTGSAVTLDSLTVIVPTSGVYSLWGGSLPFVLADGFAAIFTQTSPYNFDTSDPGAGGLNAVNNCAPGNTFALANTAFCASIAPTVVVGFNSGSPVTYVDSAHVIDTAGFDFANANPCPNPNDPPGSCNESLQWRIIGTTGIDNPGGTPEPSTIVLFSGGIALMAGLRRRRRRE